MNVAFKLEMNLRWGRGFGVVYGPALPPTFVSSSTAQAPATHTQKQSLRNSPGSQVVCVCARSAGGGEILNIQNDAFQFQMMNFAFKIGMRKLYMNGLRCCVCVCMLS